MRAHLAIVALASLIWADTVSAQNTEKNADQLYEMAVQDRLAGQNDAAIRSSRLVLAIRPDDVDARLNLALALIASDRLSEAELELDAILAKAPHYADARAARDRIARLRADGATWRLDVSTGYSKLSQGLDPWREAVVSVSRRTAWGVVGGTIEQAERFGRTDPYVEARLDRTIGRGLVYGALGGTPDADFRPEIALQAGGQIPIGDQGLAATLDAGLARYAVGAVTTLQPGVDYATPDGRLILGGAGSTYGTSRTHIDQAIACGPCLRSGLRCV